MNRTAKTSSKQPRGFGHLQSIITSSLFILSMNVWADEAVTHVPTPAPVVSILPKDVDTPSSSSQPRDPPSPELWGIHGQFTGVNQRHSKFTSPYSGANSLDAGSRNNQTLDLTLMVGRRLWQGGEIWANPEIDQGFGLSNTLGMAGFPSGEAYKVGAQNPYLRLPRLFFRQIIGLGGKQQEIESGANQLGGTQLSDNITFTIGKFGVPDIFDTNSYAHDPRADFLNWSILEGGAFDYAADSWGFTNGAAIEWNQGQWTLRGGIFQMSAVPNAKVTGIHLHQHEIVTEIEERHRWLEHPGKLKLLFFVNQANMGDYREATQLANQTNSTPDTSLVRRYSSRPGIIVNFEQELLSDLGVFSRASANNGSKEAYEFTEINRSFSAGLSLQGKRWGRPDDKLGMAAVVNELSGAAREYFSAGGMGILIGDGALNYDQEKIIEAYYSMYLSKNLKLTGDYQRVINPAYNHDRGPVSIYSVRIHAEF